MNAELKPGYKHTDLGVIPEDWDVYDLKSLRLDISDGNYSSKYPKASDFKSIGIPFIRANNISALTVLDWDMRFISTEQHKELSKGHLKKNDLLITTRGEIGQVAFVPDRHIDSNINAQIVRINSTGSPVTHKFLGYYLLSVPAQEQIQNLQTGSALKQLPVGRLLQVKIAIPPANVQEKIACSLYEIDSLINVLYQLIAKKRDIQQAAMQQLLTGQLRLPGFSGEWEVKRLGDHLSFLRNGMNSRAELSTEGDVHYLHYGDIHGSQHLLLNPAKTAMPCLPRDKAKRLDRLENGDLVFADASEDLDGVGKSVEVQRPEDLELVSGLHTIAVRFDKKVMTDGFKAYLQFIPTFRSHLRQLAAGTKVYATNRTHIASAELKIPGIEEQAAIATILSDMEIELATLEARRDKAHQLKQGMMQELLTGRIRLI